MDDESRERSQNPPTKDNFAREKIFLAEQAADGLTVVPGTSWAFHYPHGIAARTTTLAELLTGKVTSEDVVADLRPDAFTYALADLEGQGLSSVAGRVRDVSNYVKHYDYARFAQFVSGMNGTGTTPEVAQSLYDGIAQSRIRRKMIDAYGYTGRKQIEEALRLDAERTVQQMSSLPTVERVLSALKMNWMAGDQFARSEQRDQVVEQLSPEERELYDQLKDAYQEYVKKGDETAYTKLVAGIKESIPSIQQKPQTSERDESQEQLEQDLEPYKDQAVPPGTEGDPAIPPEDSDEYHSSPPISGESKEQAGTRPFFEITPSGSSTKPLTGYYSSGRKSYYDIDRKTWSKKKQLRAYTSSLPGTQRQTISGITNAGLKSVPIPNGYDLDLSSLTFSGASPEIFRDQNGCFYIKTDGNSTFSIDFLKQDIPFVGPPIAEDSTPIHVGHLSGDTEKMMSAVTGGILEKSEQLRRYLLSKHFYPGDGDLQMAQALQYKLRSESTGDTYVQNLDTSEYLECYSANTLYIAMLRKVGISARLVVGHKVEGAKDGKAIIDSQTGHAWTEVWDGTAWRRMDATPRPKQQKKDQQGDSDSPTEEAQDGGVEKQDGGAEKQDGEQGQMGEASDQDIAEGESELDNAQQLSEQMSAQKQSLDQRLEDAKSFQDVKDLLKEAEDSELFDDMKEDVKERAQAKEEQMKEVIKESLDEMVQDGFLDEERREELEKQLEESQLQELDRIREQIERESSAYNEYQEIKEEVAPLVDKWFDYFVERLPKQDEVDVDEDALTRQGSFNRHSVMKPRNLLFGTVKNPRIIRPSIKPKFLASIMVDVSGSMKGDKLTMARKQLIFYNELFSRISSEFGFIRYANTMFSDTVTELKGFDQDYESPIRHDWGDGSRSTIKARLMQALHTQGGTNMLPAIQKAAADLNREMLEYPDYASAFYFIGDGEDTQGNSQQISEFLRLREEERGFGGHMVSAIMLGDEPQRIELAKIFGDENTTVAPNFDTLIEQSMYKFDEDIEAYLADKTI
ncbi:hypothetical protein A3D80_01865 [Candidatus Roizmanbacteria bacterium RIFCSPHIGHO2_02_FULL_40_13b]|uniref:VWFA domain-containing protein n=1 Tax=Candidatus Roizmanbacteria bacterium RIFCSPHIGHO2_01_FULL_39_24 TaxID=1802032 RepID=A0A1F7GLB2_9BACT|nr:MAG: hypothetical protein A2799_01605 [Candidatus Roizmanbacteria bacterium RIFCSPHIGHO2_01_FULL_39_24]OGK27836.1 MAG: hypothetical protein A3D80_01865 [Candidatus Roizmanbacteria bacterium RIFCSPHIGHO2_02_FULL_40_13b]OGK49978.1 MAG: hypothetical protein A3A56_03025 [Candidatus Roizmanbacteria bacterium RIFCSPLOWO2_01_FULL_40_32]OGK55983.1 MAG: hypothetical protein A3H83_02820 [Candidatus Roizmanbacteria bacterium RIFCSPLOWO2_02_FULL_39_8]